MQYQDHGEVFGYSDSYVERLSDKLDKVIAERDAALAYNKTVDQMCAIERQANNDAWIEIASLKSALREAKNAMEIYAQWQGGYAVKDAIATINKVLGES